MDISTRCHYRGGKFGRAEQAFEIDFYKYIDSIKIGAEGFYHRIADFTTKKSGIVDSERIKNVVGIMLAKHDHFKSENEKKFYSSFLYCALTLCSLEFKYVSEEAPEHPFVFPAQYFDKKPDFRFFVENAVIEADPDDKTTLGLESYGMFHEGFTCLYKLLAGKEIELETVYTPVEISDREQQEIMDDLIEDTADLDDLSLYEENFFDEYDGDESDDGIDSEEIAEINLINTNKIKSVYPGYKDYITYLERFNKLFKENASTDFFKTVKEMVSAFLIEGGYSIYNNEDALVDTMVMLKNVNRTMYRSLYKRGI